MSVFLTDAGSVSSRHLTDEGFLSVKGIFSSVGVQKYKENELFDDGSPDVVVNVYRSSDTLSDPKFLESLKMKPVTVEHPKTFVNSDNYNALSRGHVGENATLNDRKLKGGFLITDKRAVEDVQNRKNSALSMGYTATIERQVGIFDGETYSAVIRNMRANHVAILKSGRCDEAVILDKKEVDSDMSDIKDKKGAKAKEGEKVVVKDKIDGKDIEDQNLVSSVVEQLLANKGFVNQILQAVTKNPNLVKQLGSAIANQSAPTGDGTGDGDSTGDGAPTGTAANSSDTTPAPAENQVDHKTVIDTAVSTRIKLLDTATSLFNLSDSDLQDKDNREVMLVCINDDKLTDETSEEFIKGRFDGLVAHRRNIVDSYSTLEDYKSKNDNKQVTASDINLANKAIFKIKRG